MAEVLNNFFAWECNNKELFLALLLLIVLSITVYSIFDGIERIREIRKQEAAYEKEMALKKRHREFQNTMKMIERYSSTSAS